MCVCPCCPCSGLVSGTLLILSPRWQTAPSTLLLQISASSHPVQPNPKVGHVLWPFWVIFFQKSKRGYLSPEGVSSLCVCVCVCVAWTRGNINPCVSVKCESWHTKGLETKHTTQRFLFARFAKTSEHCLPFRSCHPTESANLCVPTLWMRLPFLMIYSHCSFKQRGAELWHTTDYSTKLLWCCCNFWNVKL